MPGKSTENSESELEARLDKVERKLRLVKVQLRRHETALAQACAVFKEVLLTMSPEELQEKLESLMPSVGDE